MFAIVINLRRPCMILDDTLQEVIEIAIINADPFAAHIGRVDIDKIINTARFKRIVRPGETLSTTVRVTDRLGPAWYFSGSTTCEGETVAKIRFVLSSTKAMQRVLGDD